MTGSDSRDKTVSKCFIQSYYEKRGTTPFMKRLLAICILLSSCASLSPAGPSPDEGTRVNYGGKCASEDAIYVQGNRWWWYEIKGRGIPGEWHFGGNAVRINEDQIIIRQEVYTDMGSSRYKC